MAFDNSGENIFWRGKLRQDLALLDGTSDRRAEGGDTVGTMPNNDLIHMEDVARILTDPAYPYEPQIERAILRIPTVDAIPVEWLREWQDEVGTLNEWWPIIERIITVWREEQEAR